MFRMLLIPLVIVTTVFPVTGTRCETLFDIQGTATNNLLPALLIQREFRTNGPDWGIEIDLVPQTNFPGHTWLKILDPTCAKLRLSLTNGIPLRPTGTNSIASPPVKIRVSDLLNGIYRRYRSRQWWP